MNSEKNPEAHDGSSIVSESEGYIADDETRPGSITLQSLKASDDEEFEMVDMAHLPHEKPGFLSRIGHKLAGQAPAPAPTKGAQQPAPEVQAVNKGTANNELDIGYEGDEGTGYEGDEGTGYEGDEGTGPAEDIEELVHPTKSKVKPLPDRGYKSFEGSEVGTGYEEGSDGSLSHLVH